MDLDAAAIITVSISGRTARMISKYRPSCTIIGCSTHDHICRQLNLSWGVTPIKIAEEHNTDELFEHAVEAAMNHGLVKQGDLTVITTGVPLGVSGTTNLIKVHNGWPCPYYRQGYYGKDSQGKSLRGKRRDGTADLFLNTVILLLSKTQIMR